MKLLIDTHLILWAAGAPDRLSVAARTLMDDPENDLVFSAASLWEVAIKASLGRDDFSVDPRLLRRGLIDNGWLELPITSEHAVTINNLPSLHKDPFDRMLVAQANEEGLRLITADAAVASYPGPIESV